MPAPRPLSRSLVPLPGESLPGFLLRLSCRLNQPPARVAELTGLRSAGYRGSRLPPILVAGIPAPALPVFTRMTRLTDGQAAQLGLDTWQGRYPVPAADTATGYRRLESQLVFAPATRFCPECLAGDGSTIQGSFGGPWLKAWHLPVVFACPVHQRLLEHRCPDCGKAVRGSRAQSAVLPAMWVAGLHPAQCRAELIPSSGGRSLPACCGARLDQARHGRRASTSLITLQAKILDLLRPDGPVSTLSAGLPAPPVRYFADLRALGLLACSTWPAARPLSPTEEAASSVDEHVAALQREAGGQQANSVSASRVRSGIPPMDAAASGCLAYIADQILAGSPDEVREQLKLLLPAGRWKESPTYWGLRAVRSATPCSEGLYTAYAPLLWGFTKSLFENLCARAGRRLMCDPPGDCVVDLRWLGRGWWSGADQAPAVSPDLEYFLIIAGDKAAHGCGECRGAGQVLGDGHAAHVVFDGPGARDEEFAGEVVPGDGRELAGEQILAVAQVQPLPERRLPVRDVLECGGDEVA